jgi:DNA/RNA endonuclease G (NUC1)
LITGLAGGETNVTVQYGDAEVTIPVLVSGPETGPALVDESGGVVKAEDGSLVTIAPEALTEESSVNLTPLQRQDLSLPMPSGFEFATAFDLEIEDDKLDIPAQLAIPAPTELEAGTEVWFMRKGALPDETGTWKEIWLQEESGVADADGFIRTQSPPYPGILRPGEYMVAVPDGTEEATKLTGSLGFSHSFPTAFLGIKSARGDIGQLLDSEKSAISTGLLVTGDSSSVEVITLPEVGLPETTEIDVEPVGDGVARFETLLDLPAPEVDITAPPIVAGVELKDSDENGEPFAGDETVLFLSAENALIEEEHLATPTGSRIEDLVAKFFVGDRAYKGTVLPELSKEGDDGKLEVAVSIPNSVPLAQSRIVLSRQLDRLVGQIDTNPIYDEEPSEYDSSDRRPLENDKQYAFAALSREDSIAVLDALDPESVVNSTSSEDLLVGKIPVGTDGWDRPESLAVTSDNSRVYVPLRSSGGVAVVDPMMLRQVDNLPETPDVSEPIGLPDGARPQSIVIGSMERYAYIADGSRPEVFVLDIDPFSETYHQVVETIELSSGSVGLYRMAIACDGRRLFVTAADDNIYVVNIDPADQPTDSESNPRKWHEKIGTVATELGAEGLSVTNDPLVMTFTNGNRNRDYNGYGVLTIENDDPLAFEASVRYASLGLGSTFDYFDVDEGTAITVMRDGSYAFVAGRNSKFAWNADDREGGNIGIIKDPLTNPQLVAATRPIPDHRPEDLVLTNDNKYLLASYSNLSLQGDLYVFDVEETIETLERPEDFQIDHQGRGVGSNFFKESSARPATSNDFSWVPIDDINPEISIAADYEIISENRWNNNYTLGVPAGTKRAPVSIGFPKAISMAPGDWLDLKGPTSTTTDLTPTWEWEIGRDSNELKEVNLFVSALPEGQGLLPKDRWLGVLLASASDGAGLGVAEKLDGLSRPWNGVSDFNPNRIVTATWKQETGEWYWHDRETPVAPPTDDPANTSTRFTLADDRTLTAGQTYYWAVRAIDSNGKEQLDFGSFETELPDSESGNTFSSVSVITHGFKFPTEGSGIPDNIYDLGNNIAESGGDGLVMRYNRFTGGWDAIDEEGRYLDVEIEDYYGKPLVLLTDWTHDNQSSIPDSGFTEGAADAFFASLVGLDRELGGKVEYVDGEFVKRQGAVFNSPLHFIGFSRGTVVTSEMVQRMGTHFPYAGGPVNADGTPKLDSEGQPVRDLQMTTIDPHDFEQPGFSLPEWLGYEGFGTFWEPPIQVWENVTFADNYFQTVPKLAPNWTELTGTPAGRLIENADLNVFLGTHAGEENYENSRAGFTRETDGVPGLAGMGATHGRAVSWYDGTTNLEVMKSPDELYRRLGDGYYDHLSDRNFPGTPNPWYAPDHQKADFELGDENAPWEGIGTGWFYSVLGGGKDLRPESKLSERVPVSFDNTHDKQSRGDFAVPTVFNGNFDIVTKPDSRLAEHLNTTNAIPGWSFHNGVESEPAIVASAGGSIPAISSNEDFVGGKLVNVHDIPSLERHLELLGKERPSSDERQNFARELRPGEIAVKNRTIPPNWGSLRFDLHVPEGFYTAEEVRQAKEKNEALPSKELKVTIKPVKSPEQSIEQTFLLQQVDLGKRNENLKDTQGNYQRDIFGNPDDPSHDARYKLDYATVGFETFQVDIPRNSGIHGQAVKIEFELIDPSQTTKVYLDDVFFQSQHLRFGKPIPKQGDPKATQVREAFYSNADLENNPYKEALLLERPQYVLSYNGEKNITNWASWIVNRSWLYNKPKDTDSLRFGEVKSRDLREDRILPNGFYQVLDDDYQRFERDKLGLPKDSPATGRLFEETINGKTTTSKYILGHVVPQADRDRNPGNYDPSHKSPRAKDSFLAVNLLSNIVPQETTHNGSRFWEQIEKYANDFAENRGNEVYVISGTYGSKGELTRDESLNWEDVAPGYNFDPTTVKPITIPQYLWKVMLVVDSPGADVDRNTYAVGFWTENRKPQRGEKWNQAPIVTTVRDIENKTGYDFFANIPDPIEDAIETQSPAIISFPK